MEALQRVQDGSGSGSTTPARGTSHVLGVIAQHQASLNDPNTSDAQKAAAREAIVELQKGHVGERELGSNTPTQVEREHKREAQVADETDKAIQQALPDDAAPGASTPSRVI